MTINQKNELIVAVTALLERMIPVEEPEPAPITVNKPALPEMLTVKECSKLVTGLTEHTVRMLVKQGKIKYIRCGEGVVQEVLGFRIRQRDFRPLGQHCGEAQRAVGRELGWHACN